MNHYNDDNIRSVTMDGMNSFCMSMRSTYSQHGAGSGMIMYMDGFRSSLTEPNLPCLNLYFPTWTLNTKTKFIAAMIGIFITAVLVEGLSKFRHVVHSASKATRNNRRNSSNSNNNNIHPAHAFFWKQKPHVLRMTITALHGLQAFMGYILMLAVMTFSIELVVMVIFGLATGFAIFFCRDELIVDHVTANPCCNFMQEEARELLPHQPGQSCCVTATTSRSTTLAPASASVLNSSVGDVMVPTRTTATTTTYGGDCETAVHATRIKSASPQHPQHTHDGAAVLSGNQEED